MTPLTLKHTDPPEGERSSRSAGLQARRGGMSSRQATAAGQERTCSAVNGTKYLRTSFITAGAETARFRAPELNWPMVLHWNDSCEPHDERTPQTSSDKIDAMARHDGMRPQTTPS